MRARLIIAGVAVTTALLMARTLRLYLTKARNTLSGEQALADSPTTLALGVSKLVTLYFCPGGLRHLPAWLGSLLSRKNPLTSQVPWMPYPALDFLQRHLHRGSAVFEYGGGGSTLWLARHAGTVTTVEHDASWHATIESELRRQDVHNCTLQLRESRAGDAPSDGVLGEGINYTSARIEGSFEDYARAIESLPDNSLDLVVVDGRSRAACLLHAAPKLREGGVLTLDDSYRTRYNAAKRRLDDWGWPRQEFCGIRPYSLSPGRTTFWTRPPTS